jgi:hypothetical protein
VEAARVLAARGDVETMLTLPRGSTRAVVSPSLATSSRRPSAVKVTMSGRVPTPTLPAAAKVVVS